jgi:epoxyqueuosine reductase
MTDPELKAKLRTFVLSAGFVRARFLAPYQPDSRCPEQYRQGAPSLLVSALAFGNVPPEEQDAVGGVPPPGMAAIAPFARRNYYREAVKRLQKISVELRGRYGTENPAYGKKNSYRILCNSPVPEKPLAAACGLGAPGRNGLIITREAGSLIIIAAMTLPFDIPGDGPVTSDGKQQQDFPLCNGCDRGCDPETPPCVRACPTGACRGDGTLDLKRCIQWYASGKGDAVPGEVIRAWGNRLYGCTRCQDACVYNQRPIRGVASDEGPLPAYIDVGELLSLSSDELAARFKGTAMGLSWLGPDAIRRNARLASGTYDATVFWKRP